MEEELLRVNARKEALINKAAGARRRIEATKRRQRATNSRQRRSLAFELNLAKRAADLQMLAKMPSVRTKRVIRVTWMAFTLNIEWH